MKTFFFAFSAAFLCAFCVLAAPTTFSKVPSAAECEENRPGIAITIAPSSDDLREINHTQNPLKLKVMWWGITDFRNSDFINLWDHDPNKTKGPVMKHFTVNNNEGSYVFEIEQSKKILNEMSKRNVSKISSCLSYWISYVRNNNEMLFTSCLEIHPRWIENTRNYFEENTLPEILLPGINQETYNTAFFMEHPTPWYELLIGARYFKILLDYDVMSHKFYIAWPLRNTSLIEYLNDIYLFLSQTKEIVLIEFEILQETIHFQDALEKIVLTIFPDLLITKSNGLHVQIGSLLENNNRLRVSCSHIKNSEYIWNKIESVVYSPSLIKKQKSSLFGRENLWELKLSNNIFSFSHGVERTVQQTYSNVLPAFKDNLWRMVNIVTLPCIFCTNLVNFIIYSNKKRKDCPELFNSMRLLRKSRKHTIKRNTNFNIKEQYCGHDANAQSPVEVWPTVRASPKYIEHEMRYRLIQINWKTSEVLEDDLLALFEENPNGKAITINLDLSDINSENGTELLIEFRQIPQVSQPHYSETVQYNSITPLFVAKPYSSRGIITTNFSHSRPSTSDLAKGGCVGAWVAYLRKNNAVAARCLTSYPTWMWDQRSVFGTIPLRSLLLPGSHNSGSYTENDSGDGVSAWTVCQDHTVLSQLLLGIRYLDLRVGYYPDSKELLWINHDLVQMVPLRIVLDDIRAFAFLSADPVIIDIHRTPIGFDHEEAPWLLISLINATLGEYLADASLGNNVTSLDMWERGTTLIVSYGQYRLRREVPWLWPPIHQAWANAKLLEDLKSFLDQEMKEYSDLQMLWAAMGHLTPSVWDFLFHVHKGNRGWADKVGSSITEWLQESWGMLGNIFASDFLLTNDVIYTSIRLNVMREICDHKIPTPPPTAASNAVVGSITRPPPPVYFG